jgi:Flp pilus assembly protein TadD
VTRLLAALGLALALTGCSHFVVLHDPLTAAEHTDLGVAYEAAGDDALARREYRRALRLEPDHGLARFNLGNLEAKRARWSRAEPLYRRALRERPDDPDVMNNLAVVLVRRGRSLEEAEGLARRAVSLGGARDSVYRSTLAEVRLARRLPP